MDPGNERFREVWGNTQDNLETAVGTAYSSWTGFQRSFIVPTYRSAALCLNQTVQNGMVCCFGSRMAARNNYYNSSRRDSFDIFYDMYDDEVYGRDELERLLSAHDDDEVMDRGTYDSDDEAEGQAYRSERSKRQASKKGKGAYSDGAIPAEVRSSDMAEGGQASSSHYYHHDMAVEPPINVRKGLFNSSKTRLSSILYSIFPSKKSKLAIIVSSPSDSGNRPRSSTKSSSHSSETLRSRAELFSDDSDSGLLEDAQIMSDNFAANLEYRSGGESAKSISGTEDEGGSIRQAASISEPEESVSATMSKKDSTMEVTPLTDEELLKEEQELAREEEENIERKRAAAKAKAKSLGLARNSIDEARESTE